MSVAEAAESCFITATLNPELPTLKRMEIKKGIGVSPGVVISTAVVLDAEDLLIPKRSVDPDDRPSTKSSGFDAAIAEQRRRSDQLARRCPRPSTARRSAASSIFTSACCATSRCSTRSSPKSRTSTRTAEYAVSVSCAGMPTRSRR